MDNVQEDLENLLEDEWYIVRYSGETPEIALHSSLYFLTRAQDGPQQELNSKQVEFLQQAAYDRFCEIVFRDIDVKNVGTSIYRGLARTIVNYSRYCRFCERQYLPNTIGEQLCSHLYQFLGHDIHLLSEEDRCSSLNCSFEEISLFFQELSSICNGVEDLLTDLAAYYPENGAKVV